MTNEQINTAIKERDEARAANKRICFDRDIYKSQLNASKRYSEELKNELNHALAELHTLRVNTAPEPSRLEIATRIMQGWGANPNLETLQLPVSAALGCADALIAAAKETQP